MSGVWLWAVAAAGFALAGSWVARPAVWRGMFKVRREAEPAGHGALQAVLDAAPELLLLLDEAGRIVMANTAAVRLAGRSVVGAGLGEILPAPDGLVIGRALAEAWRGDLPAPWLVRIGGRQFEVSLRPVVASEGRAGQVLAHGADITTVLASEGVLAEAREAAERASAAKTKFLAAASHDLRQPLQAATMFVNVLANRLRQDPAQQELVAKIEHSLEALGDLLNALLDISKLEAGLVNVRPAEFPVNALLARMVEAHAEMAEAKGLSLRSVRSSAVLDTDPVLLERLLRHLVGNAIRYTERGGILIGCRRRGDQVAIQVWDSGIGIPGNQLKAIFKEFHQLGNEARDRRKGLGLGLAICDRLARLLDHSLTVRSVPGRGSMFEVLVPRAAEAEAAEEAAARTASAHTDGGSLIVVIDDDPDILLAMRLALEDAGHAVVAAAAADEALAGLAGRQPDAIVADYRLQHGRTGSEAIRLINQHSARAVPGILVTGDTSPERLREARASGFQLLHKPIRPEALRFALAPHLSRHAAAGSGR